MSRTKGSWSFAIVGQWHSMVEGDNNAAHCAFRCPSGSRSPYHCSAPQLAFEEQSIRGCCSPNASSSQGGTAQTR